MITPPSAYTRRPPGTKPAPSWLPNLTTIFILACLLLNYNNFTRAAGAVILLICIMTAVIKGFVSGHPLLKVGAIFGFMLVLFNVVFKFENLYFSGNSAADIEFITPILALWFLSTLFLLQNQSPDQLSQAVDRAVLGFILISLFDLGLRVLQAGPGCFSLTSGCRTAAKFGGLAFNANIAAVPLITCLFFARKLPTYIILLALIYGTMSRSGLIATAIVLVVLFVCDRDLPLLQNIRRRARVLVIMPFFVIFVFYFWPQIEMYVFTDGSFKSKISFIDYAVYNIQLAPWPILLFGDQLNFYHIIATYSYNDWSVHLAILKALWYYGFLGVIFYVLINLTLMFYSFRSALCIMAYLIMGFSGFAIFNTTMLVIPLFAVAFLYKSKSFAVTARPLINSDHSMPFGK